VQFQGMFAEYEKAQILERSRRGKAHRAKTGSVNVLSGAPFGYRYIRKSDHAGAAYEITGHEAALVAEMFRRYADDGASIADLARWLTSQGAPTRTGKSRWDRSVVWAMLRNPAYAGRAVFGKTMAISESPALNRVARLQGRSVLRAVKTVDRPKEEWTQIPVPAIVTEDTFERVQQRLEDNKRFAARNTKVPSLLQGLAACSACGYGYYRTSARTARRKIYYYRCLGSDDYRYEGGGEQDKQPVRVAHGSQGYQPAWRRLSGAPGRAAEAESRKPAQCGLDVDEKRQQEEPSPRRPGRRPCRDVTVKHVEFQDTSVVVGNSGVAEEDRARGGWARRTDPASRPQRAGPATGPGRSRPGRSAGWLRGRGPPPRNDERLRAQHARLGGGITVSYRHALNRMGARVRATLVAVYAAGLPGGDVMRIFRRRNAA
jgi:hypothetical protein